MMGVLMTIDHATPHLPTTQTHALQASATMKTRAISWLAVLLALSAGMLLAMALKAHV